MLSFILDVVLTNAKVTVLTNVGSVLLGVWYTHSVTSSSPGSTDTSWGSTLACWYLKS